MLCERTSLHTHDELYNVIEHSASGIFPLIVTRPDLEQLTHVSITQKRVQVHKQYCPTSLCDPSVVHNQQNRLSGQHCGIKLRGLGVIVDMFKSPSTNYPITVNSIPLSH